MFAACSVTASHARDLFVDDARNAFSRLSLSVTAEKVVQRGEHYLLLRIQPIGNRTIDRPDGTIDTVSLKDRRLAFLPMSIACDRMTMENKGKTYRPHALSLCTESTRLATPEAMPLFVVFKYPAAGEASVTIPVTVMEPEPPVQKRLQPDPDFRDPVVSAALLGSRELSARMRIE